MEDDLILSKNGKDLNFLEMEDDLKYFGQCKMTSILGNGRWSKFLGKWKINLIFWQIEDRKMAYLPFSCSVQLSSLALVPILVS
jgi:hypothetical protein